MINVHLGLTYACNMRCKHCYAKEKIHDYQVLHGKKLLNILEQLGTFYITYTMGETLLWKGFPQFAQMAKERGFYQILLSNGSTITDEHVVQNLVDLGIKKVGISIDSSDPCKHDENRGYPGAYKKACEAIQRLSRHPEIWTQVAMAIDSNNMCEIPEVIRQMKAIGAKSFSFLWMRTNGRIKPIENYEAYEQVMCWLIKKKDHDGLDVNVHDFRLNSLVKRMYEAQEISAHTKDEFLNMNACHALNELILIDPIGDMYMCNFEQKPFANVYTASLDQLASFKVKDLPLCGGNHDSL